MGQELQEKVEALLKKNRELIAETDVDRERLRVDALRAKRSLERAQRALRRASTAV